jgi:hypothetical protein
VTNEQARKLYEAGQTTVYGVDHKSITQGSLIETDGGCFAAEVAGKAGLYSIQANWCATREEAEAAVAAYTAECDKRRAAQEARKSAPRPKRAWRHSLIEDGEPEWAINGEL